MRIAFFGSFRIRISNSFVSPCRLTSTGRRPRNSGIMPKFRRSSVVTWLKISGSLSNSSFKWELKPIVERFFRRSLMISSNPGNAPPQINRMLFVSTVAIGVSAFFWFEPTGTSTWLPSKSFKSSCCTDSPLTSRLIVFFFFAILSISSMKMMPCSAFSTSFPAAARSLETTLSISSPIYPASVSTVASAIASGTSKSFASVLTRYVFPLPVGPSIRMLDFSISGSPPCICIPCAAAFSAFSSVFSFARSSSCCRRITRL